jgi:hypothetical protein
MKVLIACEESQTVCIAFRELGHEAYSCDIQDCSGGHPEWHIKDDAIKILYSENWDLMIAHPPCTYLSFAGNAWFDIDKYKEKAIERIQKRKEAEIFFLKIYNCKIPKIAIENPRGSMNKIIKHSQVIHPYYFGDKEKKTTCLWLKNLPKLVHIQKNDLFDCATHTEEPKPKYIDRSGKKRYFTDSFAKTPDRIKLRSKTFPGIAQAMATQWGRL